MVEKRIVGLLLLMLALAACTENPRNKQPLAHATDEITWAGRDITPNVDYFLMIGDGSSAPTTADIIDRATTAATVSVTDAVGRNWFGWSKKLSLPGDPRLWKVKSPHVIEATMRTMAYSGMYDATKRTPLVTFDWGTATDNCFAENESGGGAQIMERCKSSTSGVVKVTAPCGTKDEACCPVSTNWVNDPASCDAGLKCSSAGGLGVCRVPLGGACSTLADCVYGANACVSGVCRYLQPLGGPCSTRSDCNASASSCTGGLCTAANGLACTANNQCESKNCKSGVCSIVCTPNAACTVAGKDGLCAAGKQVCTATTKTCPQTVFPTAETCDNRDNDCDGTKDEGNPGGGATCGTNTGDCTAGTYQCQSGSVRCVGSVGSSAEVCDGRDNNCNGTTDESNVCAPSCGAYFQPCCNGQCNSGLYCDSNICDWDPPGDCNYVGEACCVNGTTSTCSDSYDSLIKRACIHSCSH